MKQENMTDIKLFSVDNTPLTFIRYREKVGFWFIKWHKWKNVLDENNETRIFVTPAAATDWLRTKGFNLET